MILTQDDIQRLESFCDDTGAYFKAMIQYLDQLTAKRIREGQVTPEEVRELYRRLSEVKLRDLGQQAFSITGPERYYLSFAGDQDSGIAAIKLYGDKTLIFDRVYGDRPAIHKRYSIVSS